MYFKKWFEDKLLLATINNKEKAKIIYKNIINSPFNNVIELYNLNNFISNNIIFNEFILYVESNNDLRVYKNLFNWYLNCFGSLIINLDVERMFSVYRFEKLKRPHVNLDLISFIVNSRLTNEIFNNTKYELQNFINRKALDILDCELDDLDYEFNNNFNCDIKIVNKNNNNNETEKSINNFYNNNNLQSHSNITDLSTLKNLLNKSFTTDLQSILTNLNNNFKNLTNTLLLSLTQDSEITIYNPKFEQNVNYFNN
ncbi:hypothetical protein ABK040_015029 [Willaertia magna]